MDNSLKAIIITVLFQGRMRCPVGATPFFPMGSPNFRFPRLSSKSKFLAVTLENFVLGSEIESSESRRARPFASWAAVHRKFKFESIK
ncbi:MAG: hypothetical protein CMO47_03170 [Verrucomicrobiales bacterium]|nr:hypothetical protein [Verrucomicrobiales bacterium]|tara:strand:- start:2730 stop:2993 length:264 start_codon:yes stop_codon:yes gene_type:complete